MAFHPEKSCPFIRADQESGSTQRRSDQRLLQHISIGFFSFFYLLRDEVGWDNILVTFEETHGSWSP